MKNMETRITELANEVVEATRMEAMFNDEVVTVETFNMELDVLLDGANFENQTTRSMISTLVKKAVRRLHKEFYELVYPPVGMDQNGNYTTNKLNWA